MAPSSKPAANGTRGSFSDNLRWVRGKQRVPVICDGKRVVEEQDVPVTREIGRGPMIDAEDIQRHLDAGTLADEIALMATMHKFPWKIEIVDDRGSR
jgi:hypothetical protein